MTIAHKIMQFNRSLAYNGKLPEGIRMMNPFREYPFTLPACEAFYNRYYSDNSDRAFIIGINPGRFGGGLTGIPFTDPKRLLEKCGMEIDCKKTHEPSSEFVYQMIEAYGSLEAFYEKFYINSACPLGFTALNSRGTAVNYNYYDRKDLFDAVKPFMVSSLTKQIKIGMRTDTAFCLGTGKNFEMLTRLNNEHRFFDNIVPLEHPRFIMQYKSAHKNDYIRKYLEVLKAAG